MNRIKIFLASLFLTLIMFGCDSDTFDEVSNDTDQKINSIKGQVDEDDGSDEPSQPPVGP